MFYLHFVDGSRIHRANYIIVSDSTNPPRFMEKIGGEPIINDAGEPFIHENKWMMGPIEGTIHYVNLLAISIAQGIGCKVIGIDDEHIDVPRPFLTDSEIVQAVMTTREAEKEFGLAKGSARKAIHQKTIAGRKSAGTWLISREEAEHTWIKRKQ